MVSTTRDGLVYIALALAAAAAMLSAPPPPTKVVSFLLASVAPEAEMLAGAIGEESESFVLP